MSDVFAKMADAILVIAGRPLSSIRKTPAPPPSVEQMIEAFDEVVVKKALGYGWEVSVLVDDTWHVATREDSVREALALLHKKHAPADRAWMERE